MLALARLPASDVARAPQTALGQRLANVLASPGAWRVGPSALWGLEWPAVLSLCADHGVPAGSVLGLAARAERMLIAALAMDQRAGKAGGAQSQKARWAAAATADSVFGDPNAYEYIDDEGNVIAPPLEVMH